MSGGADDRWYPGHLRASDADRATVAEQLHRALSDGRLTIAEFDDRIAATYDARTYGDLAVVTDDIPAPVTAISTPSVGVWKAPSGPSPRKLTRSYLRRHTLRWLGGATVTAAVAPFATDYVWFFALLLVFWAGLIVARISTATHYDIELSHLRRRDERSTQAPAAPPEG